MTPTPLQKTEITSETGIFGTSITLQFVENALQKAINTKAVFGKNVKTVRLGVGEGFLSVIARIYPDWSPSSPELPESFIAKIPNIMTTKELTDDPKYDEMFADAKGDRQDMLKGLGALITRAHNAEVSFYKWIADYNTTAKIPKLYCAEKFSDTCKQGYLLMEDFGSGCSVAKPYELLSADDIKQIIQSLAIVQAVSLKHPECLALSQLTLASAMEQFEDNNLAEAPYKQIKLKNPDLGDLCDIVLKHIDVMKDLSVLQKVNEKCGLQPLFVHGDLWSSNVMWRKNANGSRQLAGIIDWQVFHSGTPAEDLIRIISCTLSAEDRRKHADELLLYYYNEVERAYGKKLPFKFEQLKKSFMIIYPHAMAQLLPILGPMTSVEVESKYPERKEELLRVLWDKCKGILEDMIKYLKFE